MKKMHSKSGFAVFCMVFALLGCQNGVFDTVIDGSKSGVEGLSRAATAPGTILMESSSVQALGYSRVIKLSNGNLLVSHSVENGANSGSIRIYRSTNDGASFSLASTFSDSSAGWQIGAGAIYEVSSNTILLAYNLFNDNAYEQGQKLKIARSSDGGNSWTILSTLENNVWNWEPEFYRSSDGKLQLVYSYASTLKPYNLSMFDQVIVRRESSDNGISWSARQTVVGAYGTSDDNGLGMARIVQAGSQYVMAFEWYDEGGVVAITTSTDGKTWDNNWRNWKKVQTSNGWMFSTPAITYQNGALIAVGKVYSNYWWGGDNVNNGKVVLYSRNGGASWSEMDAPFRFIKHGDKTNWSPTLLPLSSGKLLMVNETGNGINSGYWSIRVGQGNTAP